MRLYIEFIGRPVKVADQVFSVYLSAYFTEIWNVDCTMQPQTLRNQALKQNKNCRGTPVLNMLGCIQENESQQSPIELNGTEVITGLIDLNGALSWLSLEKAIIWKLILQSYTEALSGQKQT